ncbi:50S ribosomal protein L11 methyltransferase [Parabacteroides sp. FAFU027]|uniref:50S ribosomal protein L11 methyltransferase n=1 Tax=Parabacteroides sp. FAFU027 TaxID=2922715 RepID=UPI001FAFFF94|nr:50S ribosomal protein L11 methyltransferase [Parabacteroides sp. FAFU027]
MNNYIEVNIKFTPSEEIYADIMASILGEKGFESFTYTEDEMKAYVLESVFSEALLEEAKAEFPMEVGISYNYQTVETKNWNEEWEKNYFQPIVIGDQCVIHSSFHQDTPKAKYDILIDPKMSFGTGHHETTSLMLAALIDADVTGKSFLDMGCGTAVLAILARMKGASPVVAIDIDEWAYENSLENIRLNQVSDITVKLGGAELLGAEKYEVILANINRNILLQDIQHYAACMTDGSQLYMSGFYVEDIPMIKEEAEKNGLTFITHWEKNRWVAVQFVK